MILRPATQLRPRATTRRPLLHRALGALLVGVVVLTVTGCEPKPVSRQTLKEMDKAAGEPSEAFASYSEALPTGAICLVNRPLRREPVPVVVLAHQLSSETSQSDPPMQRLAELLASRGIATYRVYYDVSAETEAMNIQYDSPDQLVNEVDTVFDQLKYQSWVDTNRVGLVGYDIGALIAISASVEAQFQPRALVVWSPPKTFREGFTRFLKHSPGTDEILVHFEDRRVVLTGAFSRSLDAKPPLERIKLYKGALLGITGADSVDGLAALGQYIANSSASSHDTLLLEGSDSTLGMLQKDSAVTRKAIEATADWLERTL